jgi:hypothetical protein
MKISFIEMNCPKTGSSDYHSLTPVGNNVELRIGVGISGARLQKRISKPGVSDLSGAKTEITKT